MAYVATDWSIDRATGNIRYIGDPHLGASPSYSTVIDAHRAWQDFADNAVSSGDDELDITDENPSSRSTDNIIRLLGNYNIDDTSAQHLYDGSIIQGNGGTEVVYDGIVNFGNAGIVIQIIQNGSVLANDWWNSNGGLNPDSAQGISHRFMIKTRTAGANIDGRRLLGISREFGKTYAAFPINGTSRGNNVLALSNSNDLNNQTVEGTVAGWTTITNVTEGYVQLDVNNDGTPEPFYSEWTKDTYTINQFYERMKWLTRDGSTETIYGLNGELFRGITHEITVDTPTGTFNAFEPVTWTGGTGQMLGIDSPTAGTKMWIQLLSGIPPIDNQVITGGTSAATATVNVTVVDRSSLLSQPFIGQSTGSAIIGAYGIGIKTSDVLVNDTLFDLVNAPVNPPNNVTNTVAGLVAGEDRVLVAPWDGITTDNEGNPAIQENQLSLSGSLTTDNVTAVVVSTAIPSDTPTSGTIRVTDDLGFDRRLEYSSWSGSTFNISSVDGQEDFLTVNATTGNNAYVTYIDKLADGTSASFTGVYSAPRDLVVLVRDGGGTPIKQFISAWTFAGSNSSITAIRTSDL